MIVIEQLCVNPLKCIVDAFEDADHAEFIKEIKSSENPSIIEIRKNARVLAQGLRTNSIFKSACPEVLGHICGFTGNSQYTNLDEADGIALKYVDSPNLSSKPH